MIRRAAGVAFGGIGAAFASALCCAGPLIAVSVGVSGAGLASTFEPLRPYLLATATLFLGFGYLILYREERRACEPGARCVDRRARQRTKYLLWVATAMAAAFATYPTWSEWIL